MNYKNSTVGGGDEPPLEPAAVYHGGSKLATQTIERADARNNYLRSLKGLIIFSFLYFFLVLFN